MPEISRFFGIVIFMYHREHGPPHFHVRKGDAEAVFEIEHLGQVNGGLSTRDRARVVEWAFRHRPELMENWRLARALEPLKRIDPLEE